MPAPPHWTARGGWPRRAARPRQGQRCTALPQRPARWHQAGACLLHRLLRARRGAHAEYDSSARARTRLLELLHCNHLARLLVAGLEHGAVRAAPDHLDDIVLVHGCRRRRRSRAVNVLRLTDGGGRALRSAACMRPAAPAAVGVMKSVSACRRWLLGTAGGAVAQRRGRTARRAVLRPCRRVRERYLWCVENMMLLATSSCLKPCIAACFAI